MLSFGGPFSNHLHAMAWACKEAGLASIGVVRGELHDSLTPTLLDCQAWGMRLIASQRKDYRQCQETLSAFAEPCLASEVVLRPVEDALGALDDTLVVPEGGSNSIAIESLACAYRNVFTSPECNGVTHAVCATGTGATLAGLAKAAPNGVDVIGVQAVAEGDATLERVHGWLGADASRFTIEEGHLGGFGKISPELLTFIDEFEAEHGIPLDPVYTSKVMLKLTQMIEAGYFKPDDTVLFIHTGGLQGKRGG